MIRYLRFAASIALLLSFVILNGCHEKTAVDLYLDDEEKIVAAFKKAFSGDHPDAAAMQKVQQLWLDFNIKWEKTKIDQSQMTASQFTRQTDLDTELRKIVMPKIQGH
jgi:hypothetical protein